MKTIIFAFISLFISVSFAGPAIEPAPLGELIAGKILAARPMCPENAFCITNGTTLTIEFEMLNGCQDLNSLSYTILEDGGIEVEAFRTSYPVGTSTDPNLELVCTSALEYRSEKLSVPGFFPPFKVFFKGTDVAVDVKKFSKTK
jgi:hypothetical protein